MNRLFSKASATAAALVAVRMLNRRLAPPVLVSLVILLTLAACSPGGPPVFPADSIPVDANGLLIVPSNLQDEYEAISIIEQQDEELPELEDMSEEFRKAYTYFVINQLPATNSGHFDVMVPESSVAQRRSAVLAAGAGAELSIIDEFYDPDLRLGVYLMTDGSTANERRELLAIAITLYDEYDGVMLVLPTVFLVPG